MARVGLQAYWQVDSPRK